MIHAAKSSGNAQLLFPAVGSCERTTPLDWAPCESMEVALLWITCSRLLNALGQSRVMSGQPGTETIPSLLLSLICTWSSLPISTPLFWSSHLPQLAFLLQVAASLSLELASPQHPLGPFQVFRFHFWASCQVPLPPCPSLSSYLWVFFLRLPCKGSGSPSLAASQFVPLIVCQCFTGCQSGSFGLSLLHLIFSQSPRLHKQIGCSAHPEYEAEQLQAGSGVALSFCSWTLSLAGGGTAAPAPLRPKTITLKVDTEQRPSLAAGFSPTLRRSITVLIPPGCLHSEGCLVEMVAKDATPCGAAPSLSAGVISG